MTISMYLSFLLFAAIVVVAPGPDFAVVLKNCVVGGRGPGMATSLGVLASLAVHASCAVLGVSVVLVRIEPLFQAIRWAGVAYLVYLGVRALRSARRGRYAEVSAADGTARVLRGFGQGFLSNITNPKAFAFYLSVLPQFVSASDSHTSTLLLLAFTHAAVAVVWFMLVPLFTHRLRAWLKRRPVRRAVDAATGVALIGFGAKLATES
ncbi:MAG TPA: LysE family translocator [Stackebrandtia sp.]|jgi:threonine/homoserine/homoserine lactone efflux protein|uniref:LysE family translocator n=1 Tax=Stackebrandtia sp. TaxID=2023065 RepID=UPI002D5B03FC|nr:LysE family translocator [Stackebrandtia sp.]HZE37440.1 LysE family translocator [Stackebrandtia sp.]